MSYLGPDPAQLDTCDVCQEPIDITSSDDHAACREYDDDLCNCGHERSGHGGTGLNRKCRQEILVHLSTKGNETLGDCPCEAFDPNTTRCLECDAPVKPGERFCTWCYVARKL